MIRFKTLPLDLSDFEAVKKVMEAKSLSMGKTVAELEDRFADYVGAKYAVALNSCTSALFLCAMYKGDTYEIPSMTVPLVANSIIHAGKDLEFRDDVKWVGHSYPIDNGVWDSAHEVKMRTDWRYNVAVCYSFYPTKPICSAEGGMICTNDEELVKWVRKARWYGRSEGESVIKNSWEYQIEFAGWKRNMTDIQAAIALNRLKKLNEVNTERRRVLSRYNKFFDKSESSMYLYRINVKHRDDFIKWMRARGVECGVHFAPLHRMEPYKHCRVNGDMPKTMKDYETTVSLPYHHELSDKDIDYICELVGEWTDKTSVIGRPSPLAEVPSTKK